MGNRGSSCCATQSGPQQNLDASYEMHQHEQADFNAEVRDDSRQEFEDDVDSLSPDDETCCKEPLSIGVSSADNEWSNKDLDRYSTADETHCKEVLSTEDIDAQTSRGLQEGEEEDVHQLSPDETTCKEVLGMEGPRKYFFDIKENVSSDWKDLAFHLRFSRPDIDNIASRNRDDKSSCMDLLEEWYKCNGKKATTEVLMDALSKANLQSTLDGLRDRYPELYTPLPFSFVRKSWQKRRTAKPSSKKDVFLRCVKEYYRFKLTTLKPFIWVDNFTLNFNDIYTELVLMPRLKQALSFPTKSFWFLEEEGTKLTYLDDVLSPDVTGLSKRPRCILIEGEAGGGKTTFLSKEALDAVSRISKLGKTHEIVLLIRLREVREGETIEEMVWDQCVPETIEGVDVESIRAILQKNESRILFLLDGYDELRPAARVAMQAIPKLLSGKIYLKSTVVITSRPSAGVQGYTQPDCHVRIKGFSHNHVAKYIRQYFSTIGKPNLGMGLISQFFLIITQSNNRSGRNCSIHVDDDEDNGAEDECSYDDGDDDDLEPTLIFKDDDDSELLNSLISTPIFLALVCVLWEEEPKMVNHRTMTVLYDNLLTCLVRKYCRREGLDMPADWQSEDLGHLVLQLGKLALEALLRNETLINVTDVEKEIVNWEILLKLGVISLEISASKLHPRKQLSFTHKTMQEFLAGRYVAQVLENQDTVELLQLTSINKALEHGNLLQFTCGCDVKATLAILNELRKLSRKEFSHFQVGNFEELSHLPVWPEVEKSFVAYERFAFLCLDILNERKEPNALHAVSRVLPLIYLYLHFHNIYKQHFGLMYYLQNIQTRMILNLGIPVYPALEKIVTSSIPGLQLDLDVRLAMLDSAETTARLVSVLKNCPSLRALKLSNARLTASTVRPLVRGFHHMPLLEVLDLSGNSLRDDGLKVLQSGLHFIQHLVVLRLASVGMSADGMKSLAPGMRQLRKLRELDISRNRIGDTGLASLNTILPFFTAMQVLVLSSTTVSSAGLYILVQTLCFLTGMMKLDINENDIGDNGLECLANILPHLTAMKVLRLRNIGISDKGMSALAKVIPHLVGLQVLDLSSNNIGDSGLECTAEILPHLKAVKVLYLSKIGCTDQGILALVKVLPYLVELQVINVCANGIGDSGIVSLVQTICQPGRSDIEHNSSGDLTPALHCNNTLQELYIGFNERVTGAGLGRVAQVLTTLPALTKLAVPSYSSDTLLYLTNTDAMALAEALRRLPNLCHLNLIRVSMKRAGFSAVMQAADEHPTLKELFYSEDLVPKGADTSAGFLKLAP